MEKFMLIFRNEIEVEHMYQNFSPEQMQAELEKWTVWIGGIAAQGKLVATDALQPVGKIVKGSAHLVTDGPYTESKEIVSGFLLLNAESMEEAIELSKGCPMYEYDSVVEIRPIQNYQ
ncbi:YciI family protein [Emticicia sp. 21SJ11W-3]|uniref:YciI family protein n=1 Tax=Emticicia sp. 21SJ11W-3 TaxID=2916755 RepID=UPI0020A0D55C|nr:YciI family protein [Emticicia sp. 21SJ11W-3]UTA69742.1 YciI family protein [Emticicia sp. 21SJ11W-3]